MEGGTETSLNGLGTCRLCCLDLQSQLGLHCCRNNRGRVSVMVIAKESQSFPIIGPPLWGRRWQGDSKSALVVWLAGVR